MHAYTVSTNSTSAYTVKPVSETLKGKNLKGCTAIDKNTRQERYKICDETYYRVQREYINCSEEQKKGS
jgi:hypothetical protein